MAASRNRISHKRLVNRNDALPDTSLEKVFAEFYKLKKGLEEHPFDETYTDHATIMLVTIVENMLRVRMLSRMDALSDDRKVKLRVQLLVDTAWESGGDALADWDHGKMVSNYLESIGKDGSAESVSLCVGDIDSIIDALCPKPEPYLKNTILASSYTFQSVKNIKDEFGEDVFADAGHQESDYAEMFNARHALVHSLLREDRPGVDGLALKRVRMVEDLFRRLLRDDPGVFDLYKGAALVDIDPAEALKHLEAAKQTSSGGWTFYHLGRAYRKTGDMEKAKAELLKAAKNVGGLRREIEWRRAHTDDATREWMKFDTALLALCLGIEMERLGDDDAAAECFACAVSINGESYPELYVWAAWYLEGISRFEDAIRCLDRALDCKGLVGKRRAEAYADKGVMLRILGQDGKARACFEKALELDPTQHGASEHLSELALRET